MKRKKLASILVGCILLLAIGFLLRGEFSAFYHGFNDGFNGW